MNVSEFINTVAYVKVLDARLEYEYHSFEDAYAFGSFQIPRLYCVDGFSIGVNVNCEEGIASENGEEEFGFEYFKVKWFLPSRAIDARKYNADNPETTNAFGYVDINLIEELCNEHGGLDYLRTIKENAICWGWREPRKHK